MIVWKCKRLMKREFKKTKKIEKLRPQGRPDASLGTGPAECAGRAETFELVKDVDVRLARFVPGTGAVDAIAPRIPLGHPLERIGCVCCLYVRVCVCICV